MWGKYSQINVALCTYREVFKTLPNIYDGAFLLKFWQGPKYATDANVTTYSLLTPTLSQLTGWRDNGSMSD